MNRIALCVSCLVLLMSCYKPKLKECQQISEIGYQNKAHCQFQVDDKSIFYNEHGILGYEGLASKAQRVLILGDDKVSGEPEAPESKIIYLLQKNLADQGYKDVSFVNAGVRQGSSAYYVDKVDDLMTAYNPQLVIYAVHAHSQFLRDYLQDSFPKSCPVLKVMKSFRARSMADMVMPTLRNLEKIQQIVESKNVRFLAVLLGGSVDRGALKQALGVCAAASFLAGKEVLKARVVKNVFAREGFPIVMSLDLQRAFLQAQQRTTDTKELLRWHRHYLSEAMVPWVIGAL